MSSTSIYKFDQFIDYLESYMSTNMPDLVKKYSNPSDHFSKFYRSGNNFSFAIGLKDDFEKGLIVSQSSGYSSLSGYDWVFNDYKQLSSYLFDLITDSSKIFNEIMKDKRVNIKPVDIVDNVMGYVWDYLRKYLGAPLVILSRVDFEYTKKVSTAACGLEPSVSGRRYKFLMNASGILDMIVCTFLGHGLSRSAAKNCVVFIAAHEILHFWFNDLEFDAGSHTTSLTLDDLNKLMDAGINNHLMRHVFVNESTPPFPNGIFAGFSTDYILLDPPRFFFAVENYMVTMVNKNFKGCHKCPEWKDGFTSGKTFSIILGSEFSKGPAMAFILDQLCSAGIIRKINDSASQLNKMLGDLLSDLIERSSGGRSSSSEKGESHPQGGSGGGDQQDGEDKSGKGGSSSKSSGQRRELTDEEINTISDMVDGITSLTRPPSESRNQTSKPAPGEISKSLSDTVNNLPEEEREKVSDGIQKILDEIGGVDREKDEESDKGTSSRRGDSQSQDEPGEEGKTIKDDVLDKINKKLKKVSSKFGRSVRVSIEGLKGRAYEGGGLSRLRELILNASGIKSVYNPSRPRRTNPKLFGSRAHSPALGTVGFIIDVSGSMPYRLLSESLVSVRTVLKKINSNEDIGSAIVIVFSGSAKSYHYKRINSTTIVQACKSFSEDFGRGSTDFEDALLLGSRLGPFINSDVIFIYSDFYFTGDDVLMSNSEFTRIMNRIKSRCIYVGILPQKPARGHCPFLDKVDPTWLNRKYISLRNTLPSDFAEDF